MLRQPPIAHSVALTFGMLAAINFDHEPLLSTNKIGDIGSDRLLPDEFESTKRPTAKVSPKLLLGASRMLAQPSR